MFPRFWSRTATLAISLATVLAACGYDRPDRWLKGAEPPPPQCTLDSRRCSGSVLQRCVAGIGGPLFEREQDCADDGQVCNPEALECSPCIPGAGSCDKLDAYVCDETGQKRVFQETCDPEQRQGCRAGKCLNLCNEARRNRSNVGCEYWPVDLDNAATAGTMEEEIRRFAAEDPAVAAGLLLFEVRPWYVAMKKAP